MSYMYMIYLSLDQLYISLPKDIKKERTLFTKYHYFCHVFTYYKNKRIYEKDKMDVCITGHIPADKLRNAYATQTTLRRKKPNQEHKTIKI